MLCGLFLAHAVTKSAQLFAKGQILAVAVHNEVCLVQTQLAFFVQQALVHIAGYHHGALADDYPVIPLMVFQVVVILAVAQSNLTLIS